MEDSDLILVKESKEEFVQKELASMVGMRLVKRMRDFMQRYGLR